MLNENASGRVDSHEHKSHDDDSAREQSRSSVGDETANHEQDGREETVTTSETPADSSRSGFGRFIPSGFRTPNREQVHFDQHAESLIEQISELLRVQQQEKFQYELSRITNLIPSLRGSGLYDRIRYLKLAVDALSGK